MSHVFQIFSSSFLLATLALTLQTEATEVSTHLTGTAEVPLACPTTSSCGVTGYRDGFCEQCDCCPKCWSCVELHSTHYRCAERTGLTVSKIRENLGTMVVGSAVDTGADTLVRSGFSQCPTLPRLPLGLTFADDGSLKGHVAFDPVMPESYDVTFVAVSTVAWSDPKVGIAHLEINMTITGNTEPEATDAPDDPDATDGNTNQGAGFPDDAEQRKSAYEAVASGFGVYQQWERGEIKQIVAIDTMLAHLADLRGILDENPRLEGGFWWSYLGGLHMNVHKLMENVLFECELYLGHALISSSPRAQQGAEDNLEGCYAKRTLEAAKFMWMKGMRLMLSGETNNINNNNGDSSSYHNKWAEGQDLFARAAAKKDGWGWGVNNGDIWIAAGAACLMEAMQLQMHAVDGSPQSMVSAQVDGLVTEAGSWLNQAKARAGKHPWLNGVSNALDRFREVRGKGGGDALESIVVNFSRETMDFCSKLLAQMAVRTRKDDVNELLAQMPGHNMPREAAGPSLSTTGKGGIAGLRRIGVDRDEL